MASYGERFGGVKPKAEEKSGFKLTPWGEYLVSIGGMEEAENGDLAFNVVVHEPEEYKGVIKYQNIYAGESGKRGPRKPEYVARMQAHVAKLIEAVGYADFKVSPHLSKTHKPLSAFTNTKQFEARKFLGYIGQEFYVDKNGNEKVKNTLDSFEWTNGTVPPAGPDAEQSAPRSSGKRVVRTDTLDTAQGQYEAFVGSNGPDYSDTGAAEHPPAYATTAEEAGMTRDVPVKNAPGEDVPF